MKYLIIFTILIGSFLIVGPVSATQHFIDSSCATPGTGHVAECDGGADDSMDNLSDFTSHGAAGDIATIRGGIASGYETDAAAGTGADLSFTNDGTIPAPITIERDYDNNWGDAWTSSSQTYTVTFGSNTWGGSASITGIDTGDWIWVDDENNRLFAYEVASAGGTGGAEFTTYLPYKGNSAGTGLYLNNMKANPYWGKVAGDYNWLLENDRGWKFQGIDIRGTDAFGNVNMYALEEYQEFKDCIFQGNGTADVGVMMQQNLITLFSKCRFYNHATGIYGYNGTYYNTAAIVYIFDSLFDGNNATATGYGISTAGGIWTIESSIFKNNGATGLNLFLDNVRATIRNCSFDKVDSSAISSADSIVLVEDYKNVVGKNISNAFGSSAYLANTGIKESISSASWDAGTSSLVFVSPSTNQDTEWYFSQLKLFEYPIYADTTNKQYLFYFMSPDIASWSADPTAAQLWIECEYYGVASGADRRLTKSTGVVDFNGLTTWQSISVQCQPAQTGVLYLRGWYAKTKEAGSNAFYLDPEPVISTP